MNAEHKAATSAGRGSPARTREGRPVPRVALSREEAAVSLGLSLDTFKRRVLPELPVIYLGRRRLIRVADLERWAAGHVTAPVRETMTGSGSRTGSGVA